MVRAKKELKVEVDPAYDDSEDSGPAPEPVKVKKARKPRKKKVKAPEPEPEPEPEASPDEEEPASPVKKTRKKRVKDPNAPKKPPSAWVLHVKAFREENPGMSYKTAMKSASATYKKQSKVTAV